MVSMRGDRRVIVDVNDEIEKGGSASRSLSGRSYHVDRWFRQAVVRLGFSLRAGCRARHSLSIGGLGIPHWSSPARPRCTRFRRRRCVDGGATDTVGSAPANSLNPSRSKRSERRYPDSVGQLPSCHRRDVPLSSEIAHGRAGWSFPPSV